MARTAEVKKISEAAGRRRLLCAGRGGVGVRTIREVAPGKLILRLFETKGGFSGAVIGGAGGQPTTIGGADPEDVWRRLQQEAGKADRSYFGFDGARARFLHFFADGFDTPGYAVEERTYEDTA